MRMFVPSFYREPESSWMAELIRGNPLALAVTSAGPDSGPFATHLPVIFDPEAPEVPEVPEPSAAPDGPDGAEAPDGSRGPLVGATLLGHMNRANPHWAALESGGTVLLTFTGPHSYV